jgi:hypothetical protein
MSLQGDAESLSIAGAEFAPRESQIMFPSRLTAVLLSVAPAALTTACAGIESVDGKRYSMASADFRSYAEAVFRRQNLVMSEIAFALDSETLTADERTRIEAAEDGLFEACALLNEIAVRRRDSQRNADSGGLDGRLRAGRSVPECERAVVAAETLL